MNSKQVSLLPPLLNYTKTGELNLSTDFEKRHSSSAEEQNREHDEKQGRGHHDSFVLIGRHLKVKAESERQADLVRLFSTAAARWG